MTLRMDSNDMDDVDLNDSDGLRLESSGLG